LEGTTSLHLCLFFLDGGLSGGSSLWGGGGGGGGSDFWDDHVVDVCFKILGSKLGNFGSKFRE
jgi:hypothetical protein